jgi:sugar O-acyltransferase (sialic acid O-acetyltransferase NeuD family)
MPHELFIIGTSGLAKESAQLARQIDPNCKRWCTISYVTNDAENLGILLPYGKISILDQDLQSLDRIVDIVIGIGNPNLRKKISSNLIQNPIFKFPNLVHPTVSIDPDFVKMGYGNMVTKGVVVTCDIQIGNFNLLNLNSTLGHDSVIGHYNVINPSSNVSGGVKIGNGCLVGTGAQILQNLTIGSEVYIGAGAVVTRSIMEAGTYIGTPARLKVQL